MISPKGRVDDVTGGAELVCEREESRGLALGVMEEQDLGHTQLLPRAGIAKPLPRPALDEGDEIRRSCR